MDELKLDIVYYFRAPRDRDFNSTIIPKAFVKHGDAKPEGAIGLEAFDFED